MWKTLVVKMIRTGLLLLCNVVPSSHVSAGKARLCDVVVCRVCYCLVALVLEVTAVEAFLCKV